MRRLHAMQGGNLVQKDCDPEGSSSPRGHRSAPRSKLERDAPARHTEAYSKAWRCAHNSKRDPLHSTVSELPKPAPGPE